MIEDIRTYARGLLAVEQRQTRDQYINAVRSYAVEKHGDKQDVKMHAERTARYLWAARPTVNG